MTDGEQVTQVRDKGILAGEGDRSRKTHRERDVHGRRILVGDILLPRRQEPRGQLRLRLCLHEWLRQRVRGWGILIPLFFVRI